MRTREHYREQIVRSDGENLITFVVYINKQERAMTWQATPEHYFQANVSIQGRYPAGVDIKPNLVMPYVYDSKDHTTFNALMPWVLRTVRECLTFSGKARGEHALVVHRLRELRAQARSTA